MTTKRLYYDDSYLTTFEARVLELGADERGARVALDQTAFYPEGGGQPSDRGTIGGVAVTDVQSAEDGKIWHWVDTPITQEVVHCEVDWTRRFDHMQQHHGQHLLSAAFENLFGYSTTSFHLGTRVTIDLATSRVAEEELHRAEAEANDVVWEDRPIDARFVAPDELAAMPLRKMPTVASNVRVVSVRGFDHSPCGGTHPRSTGAVGIIYVVKSEQRGDQTRIEFACGNRVIDFARTNDAIVRNLCATLTVGAHELEDAVDRVRDSETAHRRRLQAAERALLQHEVQDMVSAACGAAPAPPAVIERFDDRPFGELQALARAIAEAGVHAVLGTSAPKAQVVVARPEDSNVDCGEIVRRVTRSAGGSGGGRPAMASGGVPDPERLEEVMSALAREVAGS